MPETTFRGDPYRVLGVARDATDPEIKRRWRELAREHHPDRIASGEEQTDRQTTRMARINAAYDMLRDPVRRARYDAMPQSRRTAEAERTAASQAAAAPRGDRPVGPPPPPPTRPVTARFDTTAVFHRRNTTTSQGRTPLRGHPPISRDRYVRNELRASTPTGPVERRTGIGTSQAPSLEEARGRVLEFGRFHGFTLGEVADVEPTYIDWIAQTITRDRDLVRGARVIQADLDERGIVREVRSSRPGGAPHEATPAG